MSESSRKAVVVPIELKPHNNADSLSLVVVDGFQLVVNTEMWAGKTSAVFLEPETIVKTTRPEFSFLKRDNRDTEVIRAKRLRGEWSVGLLVPTPEGFNIGDDCWDFLELEHYEAPESGEGGSLLQGFQTNPPNHWVHLGKYDVENYRKYKRLLIPGELINLSQKYHGTNSALTYEDGQFHARSRSFWRSDSEDTQCDYHTVIKQSEEIQKFLKDNPTFLLCGEIIGRIQKGYSYGIPNGQVGFKAFDIRKPDYSYMGVNEFRDTVEKYNIPATAILGGARLIPYSDELVLKEVDGMQPECPNQTMEGLVVRPANERYEIKLNGRLILKCVANSYLEKQGKK